MDYKKLGIRVKAARKSKGYTQSELAELTGYSVQHISHVETGNTKLSTDLLIEIANVLGVSVDDLLVDSLNERKMSPIEISIEVSSDKEKAFICKIVNELKKGLEEFK